MTPEEISALPIGALVIADGIFYLVYDERLTRDGLRLPLVTVIDSALASETWVTPDFREARRIA